MGKKICDHITAIRLVRKFCFCAKYLLTLLSLCSREAIENLDSILDLPGLDGAFVGPSDLSISLGFPPSGSPTEPVVTKAIDKVLEGCKKRGKLRFIYCGDKERARQMLDKGW